MATGRVCSAQLVLKISNSKDSVTPGKALVDLAFPLQVSNRPILLRTSKFWSVHGIMPPFECIGLTSLSSHYSLLRLSVSLITGGRGHRQHA